MNYKIMESQLRFFEVTKERIDVKKLKWAGLCSDKTVHKFLKSKGYKFARKTGWVKNPDTKIKICYV